MAKTVATDVKNTMLDAFRGMLNGGKVRFYTGSRPAGGNPVTTQVLLAEVTLANPCAPSAVAGELNLFDPASVNTLAAGTCVWARYLSSADAYLSDVDVTNAAGTGEIKLSNTVLTFPGTVDIQTINFFIN